MPPEIKDSWDDNNVLAQASIIGYSQLREYEDNKEKQAFLTMPRIF